MKLRFICFTFIMFAAISLKAQFVYDNIPEGLNVARSFNSTNLSPAQIYVYIPDSGASHFNLRVGVGYKTKKNQFSFVPYAEVEKNTAAKTKQNNYSLGMLSTLVVPGSVITLDNALNVRYKRDYIEKKYNLISAGYYLNPYFPSIKNDFLRAVIPGGKRLSVIDSVLKYKNTFSLVYYYEHKLNSPNPSFDQNSSSQLRLDWSLYYMKEKKDLVEMNVGYYFGAKFSHDEWNKKYFNFFIGNLTYYIIRSGKNSVGIRYEYVNGDNVIDNNDDYQIDQNITLTFRMVLF